MQNALTPQAVPIIDTIQEARDIFSLVLEVEDFDFQPGQFNMLYHFGVGEVPISIVSDPAEKGRIRHTIRAVGRVTKAMASLKAGDQLGLRGPYGRGWPLRALQGRDVVIATGGLGCAPVVSAINYIMQRRAEYGRMVILQGVKHSNDLLWRHQYEQWQHQPNTEVLLAADVCGDDWPWCHGRITTLMKDLSLDAQTTSAMMCGPEPMMLAVIDELRQHHLPDDQIWMSMERNMHCALSKCGHCQMGPYFVCEDGPVFNYDTIKNWLGRKGI